MGQQTDHESGVGITSVRISTTSGSVSVVGRPGLTAVESAHRPIVLDGAVATVQANHHRTVVAVPEGTDLVIGTVSGRVEINGVVGTVAVTTTSGRVQIDDAVAVDVRTRSGHVIVGRSRGDTRVSSTSGRVEIEHSGAANVTTVSGRIVLRDVAGAAHAHCVSGRIEIAMAEPHDVDAETVSGRISISLPPEAHPRIDTPSTASIPIVGDHDCVITARSGSGRVDVSTR